MRLLRRRFGVSSIAVLVGGGLVASALAPVFAGETVIYVYDELGRLVEVKQSGTINNGVNTQIAYDAAGNRTSYEVTGSDGAGSDGGITGGVGENWSDDGSGSGDEDDGGSSPPPETPPSFAINDIGINEGQGAVFTISKSGNVQNSYSVSWYTSNGTAEAGSDFGNASGTLTFAANETVKQVSIATVDDDTVEGLETFYLNLNGTSGGATISDPQGAVQITDNDVATNDPPVAEDDVLVLNCGTGSVDALTNDTDPEGDTLSIISVVRVSGATNTNSISGGTITVYSGGGEGVLRYTVRDTAGNTDTADVNVFASCFDPGGLPQF